MEDKTLQHHGILGMKWGVRRYQNKDGTLTAAGKKRYSAEMEKLKEEEKVLKNKQRTKAKVDRLLKKRQELDNLKDELAGKTKNASTTTKAASPDKPKSIKDMTDEELVAKINRLRLEQTLASLTPKDVTKGEKFVDKVLKPAGKFASEKFGNVIVDAAKKKLNQKLGLDVKDEEMAALKKEADKMGLKKTIAEAKAAIKKANGENSDSEYEKLKRDADIAGFKQKISTSESIRRKNRKEAEKSVDEEIDETIRRSEERKTSSSTSTVYDMPVYSSETKNYSNAGKQFLLDAPIEQYLLPEPKKRK